MTEDATISAIESGELTPFDILIIDKEQDILTPEIMNTLDWFFNEGISRGRGVMFLDITMQANVYNKLEDKIYYHLLSRAMNLKLSINMRNPVTICQRGSNGYRGRSSQVQASNYCAS